MKKYFTYDYFIYTFAITSIVLFVTSANSFESTLLNGRWMGYTSIVFLYISLLASALNSSFKNNPLRMWLVSGRKAHGVAAFIFGQAHGSLMLIKYLGGPFELLKMDNTYQVAILSGSLASYILLALALTSNSFAMRKLGVLWKKIHRSVYFASVLILAHVVIIKAFIGTIFDPLSVVFFVLMIPIVVLEIIRLYKHSRSLAARKKKLIS